MAQPTVMPAAAPATPAITVATATPATTPVVAPKGVKDAVVKPVTQRRIVNVPRKPEDVAAAAEKLQATMSAAGKPNPTMIVPRAPREVPVVGTRVERGKSGSPDIFTTKFGKGAPVVGAGPCDPTISGLP